MAQDKLRQRIAWEAARLLYRREESEYFRARLKAARLVSKVPVDPRDMPTRRDIRDQIDAMADKVREAGGDPGAYPPLDVYDPMAIYRPDPPDPDRSLCRLPFAVVAAGASDATAAIASRGGRALPQPASL